MNLHEEHQAAQHQARAKALAYAGPRLSTIGPRVVPHAPRALGRAMRDGSFERRILVRLPAPPPGHWSEAQ